MEFCIKLINNRNPSRCTQIIISAMLLTLIAALNATASDLPTLRVAEMITKAVEKWPTLSGDRSVEHLASQPLAHSSVQQAFKTDITEDSTQCSIAQIFRKYRNWLLTGLIAATVCLISIAVVVRLYTQLVRINKSLKAEIAKRSTMESRLRASELRLQTILDHSIAGIVIIDPETHIIIDANQSALEMIGACIDQVVGRICHQFICPTQPGDCPLTDREEILDKVEHELIRYDGSRCAILKTVIPISINGQNHLLNSFIDISKIKESQAALEDALARAKEANNAKSQFLATMSHELRTPMNGIIGMTDILLETALNMDQLDFARTIKTSAQGLLRLINDILDLSKIEEGQLILDSEDFDFSAVIEELVQPTLTQASNKGLGFSYFVDKKIPARLRGDVSRLKQILENLLNNAVKFTFHGEIFMHIHLQTADANHCILRISVKDTGIGIEPEISKQIFTPFTQADGSYTRQFGGAGLGLTIARHLAILMDGEMGMESIPEKGSNFWFTAKFDIPYPKARASTAEIENHHRQKILIVEDNLVNQKVLLKILCARGFEVQIVNTGREAVTELRKCAYDLVLMDLQMPEMNGFEATTAIRNPNNDCLNPQVPIIAVTANTGEADRQKSLEAGMNDFLPKPFTPRKLMKKIERWQKGHLSEVTMDNIN